MVEETPTDLPKGKKSGDFVKKHKWYIIGGVFVTGVLFFLLSKHSSGGTQNAEDYASQNAINPATGYLYGSPADIAAQGGSSTQTPVPGPPGPAGPAGPAGPPGPVQKVTLPAPTHIYHRPARPVSHPTINRVSHVYVVKPGDNLSAIAAKEHVPGGWQSIYAKNRSAIGKNPNLIHPGLRLTL